MVHLAPDPAKTGKHIATPPIFLQHHYALNPQPTGNVPAFPSSHPAEENAKSPFQMAGTYGTFAEGEQLEILSSQDHLVAIPQSTPSTNQEKALLPSISSIRNILDQEPESTSTALAHVLSSHTPLLPTSHSSKVPVTARTILTSNSITIHLAIDPSLDLQQSMSGFRPGDKYTLSGTVPASASSALPLHQNARHIHDEESALPVTGASTTLTWLEQGSVPLSIFQRTTLLAYLRQHILRSILYHLLILLIWFPAFDTILRPSHKEQSLLQRGTDIGGMVCLTLVLNVMMSLLWRIQVGGM